MKLELQNAKLRFFFSLEIASSPPWSPTHSSYFPLRSGGGWSGTEWETLVTRVSVQSLLSQNHRELNPFEVGAVGKWLGVKSSD